jgi:hypothetical protein
MFRRTSSLAFAFLSLALGLALPIAVRAQKEVDPVPALTVTPNPVAAGKAFRLTLNGLLSDCNTVFTRESVTVAENRINLSYVANTFIVDPPIVIQKDTTLINRCPIYSQNQHGDALIPPYSAGPTFMMPALKAGTYEVWATRMYECLYTVPQCKIAVQSVSAGKLTVLAGGEIEYSINPTSAQEGKDFELSLLSYQFNCGTSFDNLSVGASGTEIILTFLDHEKADVVCPAIYKPYGPTFKMGALKAGSYKVKAYRLPACYPCKMAGEVTDAGTLTITGGTDRNGWFLKQRQVMAGKPFTLQLLNNAYGNCQTSFSHKSISSSSGIITASFLAETNPDIVCITDIRPHGPAFEMAALNVGIYPVYVNQLLQCQVTAPFCAIKMPMPVPSDTLVVTQTLSALISDLRAGAPKAELLGSRAAVTLPEGIGGTWKAELLTLNGQRLSAASVNAEGGQRAEFDLGLKPQRGVWLLRLSSPDGDTHMIPLIRKE